MASTSLGGGGKSSLKTETQEWKSPLSEKKIDVLLSSDRDKTENPLAEGALLHMLEEKASLGMPNKSRVAMQCHHSPVEEPYPSDSYGEDKPKQEMSELICCQTHSCTPKHLRLQHGPGSYLQSRGIMKTLFTVKNICIHYSYILPLGKMHELKRTFS